MRLTRRLGALTSSGLAFRRREIPNRGNALSHGIEALKFGQTAAPSVRRRGLIHPTREKHNNTYQNFAAIRVAVMTPGEYVTSPLSTEAYVQGELPLADLAPPKASTTSWPSAPPVTPRQRLYFYSPEQWEEFIEEWVTGLKVRYEQIKRLGGSNDRGADVAAFKTPRGFEDAWDCFQGKHYAKPLIPADAYPEIFKVFASVVAGHYVLPDKYVFLSPKGCGATLNRLLSRPSELRNKFLEQLTPGSTLIASEDLELVKAVRALAEKTGFEIFGSAEITEILEVHRRTPYYSVRFAESLRPRSHVEDPPDTLQENETPYVAQLIQIYSEKYPSENFAETHLAAHPKVSTHFTRQRKSFYSAEALRLYARDSVPEGTFEALQADIYDGVVEIAESDHSSGMERLTKVLSASGQLDLSAHTLITVSTISDRKGICHQLANEDRLRWMGHADEVAAK